MQRGSFCIGTNPNDYNGVFSSCGDHSSGSGNMFISDGSPTPNQKILCQNVNVLPQTEYEFSTWLTDVIGVNPPLMQFTVNGVSLGNDFQAPNTPCLWTEFAENWWSGTNTSAEICIVNKNTSGNGNDFALDDISFKPICIETDSVIVTVHDYPVVDLGVDTNVCSPSKVLLDPGVAFKYTWSNGDSSSTLQIDSTGIYSVVAENEFGCSDSDSVFVGINNTPIVDLGNDTTFCAGGSVLLDAQNAGSNYSWNTGSTIQTITADFTAKYKVKVTDVNNCVDSDSVSVTVVSYPDSLVLNYDSSACEGELVLVELVSDATYQRWDNGGSNSTFETDTSGNYRVVVWNEKDGVSCSLTDSLSVQFYENPIVDLGNDTTFCAGGSVVLDAQNAGANFEWNSSATTSSIVVHSTGLFEVEVITHHGCKGSDSLSVHVVPFPDLIDLFYDSKACQGDTILAQVTTDAQNILWFNGSNSNTQEFYKTGTYPIILWNEKNEVVCSVDDSVVVEFFPYPKIIEVSPIKHCFEFDEYLILNVLTEGRWYDWGYGFQRDSSFEVTHPGIYEVVIGHDQQCTVSQEVLLEEICPVRLFVPNAFTPNGDGKNDYFSPVLANELDVEFFIFNRWGEQIFHGKNASDVWDGTYLGQPVQMDVYVWKVRVKGYNTDNNIQTVNRIGHVSLIR